MMISDEKEAVDRGAGPENSLRRDEGGEAGKGMVATDRAPDHAASRDGEEKSSEPEGTLRSDAGALSDGEARSEANRSDAAAAGEGHAQGDAARSAGDGADVGAREDDPGGERSADASGPAIDLEFHREKERRSPGLKGMSLNPKKIGFEDAPEVPRPPKPTIPFSHLIIGMTKDPHGRWRRLSLLEQMREAYEHGKNARAKIDVAVISAAHAVKRKISDMTASVPVIKEKDSSVASGVKAAARHASIPREPSSSAREDEDLSAEKIAAAMLSATTPKKPGREERSDSFDAQEKSGEGPKNRSRLESCVER